MMLRGPTYSDYPLHIVSGPFWGKAEFYLPAKTCYAIKENRKNADSLVSYKCLFERYTNHKFIEGEWIASMSPTGECCIECGSGINNTLFKVS